MHRYPPQHMDGPLIMTWAVQRPPFTVPNFTTGFPILKS